MSSLREWFRHFTERHVLPRADNGALAEGLQLPASAPIPPHSPRRNIEKVIAAAESSLAKEAAAAAAADSHNAFALALHAVLSRQCGNLLYSPLSIRMALAMTYAGARGDTADEMRAALRAESPGETLQGELDATIRRFNGSTDAACEVLIANALWAQMGAPLLPAFVEAISQHFSATVGAVDFRGDSSGARKIVNDWVSTHTRHRIPELLDASVPTPDTRLILANTVYFKGPWRDRFERRRTRETPFYLEDGAAVPAQLMHETTAVGYRTGPGYQAVTLPYGGTTLAMMILLPDRRDGLRDLETALTIPMVRELARLPGRTQVELFLPRFRITWGGDLVGTLRELGIRSACTPEADFSAINGRKPPDEEALYVSHALHKAFCEVNEEGTEAAAASAIDFVCLGIPSERPQPPPVFRADHPFLFAIVDAGSGAILFLGRVVDPTRET